MRGETAPLPRVGQAPPVGSLPMTMFVEELCSSKHHQGFARMRQPWSRIMGIQTMDN